MDTDSQRAQAELDEIEQLARQSLAEVRATVTRLRAPQLPEELDVARTALEAGGISAEIRAEEERSESQLLAWECRSTLVTASRSAQATRCLVQLDQRRLCVADDGVGTTGDEGNGLRGLRERAAAEAAELNVGTAYPELAGTSPQAPGTQVEVTLR